MKIITLNSDTQLWDDFVMRQSAARGPHLSAWKKVIEESLGHTCIYLMATENSVVHGVLPLVYMHSVLFGKFLISVPFLNYGGILSENPAAQQSLYDFAHSLAEERGAEFVELRHEAPQLKDVPTRQHRVTMILDLPADPDMLWKKFRGGLRSQVRRAMRENMVVRIGREEELKNFYSVYCLNMRDLGTPALSQNFFALTLKYFPQASWIFSILLKDQSVAAGFVVGCRDTLEIPWASSLREYNHLAPNMLLYWSMLEFATKQGYKHFDFGRCKPGSGPHKFKTQWGPKEVPLHWQYWVANGNSLPQEMNPDNPKYHRAIQVWQKLPLAFTRWAGPKIIRHIP